MPLGSGYRVVDSRWKGLHLGQKLTRLINAAGHELKRSGCAISHLGPAFRVAAAVEDSPRKALAKEFLDAINLLAQGKVRPDEVPWEDYSCFLLKPTETLPRLAIGPLALRVRPLYYVAMLERVVLQTITRRRSFLGPNGAGPLIQWVEDAQMGELKEARSPVNALLSFTH